MRVSKSFERRAHDSHSMAQNSLRAHESSVEDARLEFGKILADSNSSRLSGSRRHSLKLRSKNTQTQLSMTVSRSLVWFNLCSWLFCWGARARASPEALNSPRGISRLCRSALSLARAPQQNRQLSWLIWPDWTVDQIALNIRTRDRCTAHFINSTLNIVRMLHCV